MKKGEAKGSLGLYRAEMAAHRRIKEALAKGPKTVPELSGALGMPSWQVMMYLMAMRRYSLVEELPKERRDRYYRYQLKPEEDGGGR